MSETWQNVEPGKRPGVMFVYSQDAYRPSAYSYYRSPTSLLPERISPAECMAIPECNALHADRMALVGAAKTSEEDAAVIAGLKYYDERKARSAQALEERKKTEDFLKQADLRKQQNERDAERRAAAEKAARTASSSEGVLGALGGAIAQIAGAAGGKNAAQLQALGGAMQGAEGGLSNVAAHGINSAGALQVASAASSASEFPGVDLGKNVKFGKSAGNCVKVIRMPKESTYDVETPGLQNTCGVEISVVYCYEGGSFAGMSRGSTCAQQNLGRTKLTPNEKRKIMEVDSVKALYVQACEKPFVSVVPTWNGNTPKGACITSSKYGWGVGYMGGDMRD
ncbi:hypothetical protein [Pandoraea bronchicola]|nr:hypothetical protein [Pandoraea bronchicola]